MLSKLVKIAAGGVLILLLAAGVYWGISAIAPPDKGLDVLFPVSTREKHVLGAENILRREVRYLCGDTKVTYQGMVPENMWGKEISEMAVEYPAEQGWIIDNTSKPLIVLTKQVDEFCPEHVQYSHLGLVENNLAVFEGPVGYDQKLIRVEKNISFDMLNHDLRDALQQSVHFFEQSLERQEQLRKQLEFKNKQVLNAALENIDEME